MLMPKRVKYRKQMRGRMRGKALRGAEVTFGEYGLQALEPGWISARQIESARRALVRVMRRRGKMWIRIFPDKPFTQKPPETRMGKGKGNVEYWVAVVRPGRVMFEIAGLPESVALEALHQASYKLPIRTKAVSRLDITVGEQA
jgi:large subunit ribosomal protein L16